MSVTVITNVCMNALTQLLPVSVPNTAAACVGSQYSCCTFRCRTQLLHVSVPYTADAHVGALHSFCSCPMRPWATTAEQVALWRRAGLCRCPILLPPVRPWATSAEQVALWRRAGHCTRGSPAPRAPGASAAQDTRVISKLQTKIFLVTSMKKNWKCSLGQRTILFCSSCTPSQSNSWSTVTN